MEVSIIIVNYNTLDYTLKCLESIYIHSSSFSFEIILVDNASANFNKNLVLSRYPEIRIIINNENAGFTKAVNQGIAYSTGEYILLANNDTELTENSIYICLEFLRSNEIFGFISPKIIYPDGEIQTVANSFPSLKTEILKLFRVTKILPAEYLSKTISGEYFDHQTSRQVDWVWGTFLFFQKKLLKVFQNNKLPDNFFLYYEDVLWCYIAKKNGFPAYYLAETSIIHHLSKSLGTDPDVKNELIMKNEKFFLILYKGSFYAFAYFILKGLVYLSQKQKHLRKLGFKYFNYFSI
jgi:GT2 family glycosyltransferase